jgi:hypothetical protein
VARIASPREGKHEMGKRWAIAIGVAAAGVMALGASACGGDDDEETTEASAEKVTVTNGYQDWTAMRRPNSKGRHQAYGCLNPWVRHRTCSGWGRGHGFLKSKRPAQCHRAAQKQRPG